jgi:hypothetical protein
MSSVTKRASEGGEVWRDVELARAADLGRGR